MKNIRKILQKIFKVFFYKLFILLYGKIKGKISCQNDARIKVENVDKKNGLKYNIYKINDGRLYTDRIHDTAIILDNNIVDGPSFQLRSNDNDIVEKNIVFHKGTPRIKKFLNGKVLSLLTGGAGNDNYFHWLFDVLPRFGMCENIIDLNEIDYFLLPNVERNFQRETLDLMNIPSEKILSSKKFRHIGTKELFVTDHPYTITNNANDDIQNIPIWISEWLKKKYSDIKISKIKKLPEKVFIDSRDSRGAKNKLRLMKNEKDVADYLEKDGFKSIILSDLHFSEQVNIFQNAKIIVGLHGAGFANVCFCKAGTKIIELKSNRTEKLYENLSLANGLDYRALKSEPTKFISENDFGEIEVSISMLKKIIEN